MEFHRPRHGIYREIPYKYTDEFGRTIKTPIKVLSVTDISGRKINYKVSRTGNVINLRIGDRDKYVSGIQNYVITYFVENAILFFDSHDELYWNVTGNYWQSTIMDASVKVILVTEKMSKELRASCYTGVYGSRESNCRYKVSSNIGEFYSEKVLNPGEGFTIAFGWDKGLISPPSGLRRILWIMDIKENWIFIIPVFSLAFMVNLWYRRGRDLRLKGLLQLCMSLLCMMVFPSLLLRWVHSSMRR